VIYEGRILLHHSRGVLWLNVDSVREVGRSRVSNVTDPASMDQAKVTARIAEVQEPRPARYAAVAVKSMTKTRTRSCLYAGFPS
jgi:hypothetical protein